MSKSTKLSIWKPRKSERQHLECFVGLPWLQYLNIMAPKITWADHVTLQAASNFYGIKLQIVSYLGNEARTLNQPQEFKPMATLYLGRFAEGADTVNLYLATDDADSDDAVGLSADNDGIVYFKVAANDAFGPDVAADDAVGLKLELISKCQQTSHDTFYMKYGKLFFAMQFLNRTVHGPIIDDGYLQVYEVFLVNFIKKWKY